MIPRRLSVEYISFSAHVDGPQNTEFIEAVGARHVVSPILFSKKKIDEALVYRKSKGRFLIWFIDRFWFMASRQRWPGCAGLCKLDIKIEMRTSRSTRRKI